uniref:T-lymphocyte surface antigen Ly-9-like n=1 Tax=Scatophagus argus TaxID=75038 RepID=UPI001ED7F110|nr:T-lymphocyte surface antigen Ly-9-like [Scatophagus argus]
MLTLNMKTELRRKNLAVYIAMVLLCCACAVEERETVKAREEVTVTLNTVKSKSHNNTQIMWIFGPKDVLIATVKAREVKSDYDEHFRDRLQLDSQTGALTITQLRVNDSGIYMCQSIGTNILSEHFRLIVYSSICPPSVNVNASLINTSCSSITVECCVDNSRDLTLSWYRGSDRLKNMSSPDLSSRLSLALEIESHDGDDYSCVAENPVEKKSTKLHTGDTCLKGRGTSSWCETEATVRLVFSAVIGMALIVLLVDHIRLRR